MYVAAKKKRRRIARATDTPKRIRHSCKGGANLASLCLVVTNDMALNCQDRMCMV